MRILLTILFVSSSICVGMHRLVLGRVPLRRLFLDDAPLGFSPKYEELKKAREDFGRVEKELLDKLRFIQVLKGRNHLSRKYLLEKPTINISLIKNLISYYGQLHKQKSFVISYSILSPTFRTRVYNQMVEEPLTEVLDSQLKQLEHEQKNVEEELAVTHKHEITCRALLEIEPEFLPFNKKESD